MDRDESNACAFDIWSAANTPGFEPNENGEIPTWAGPRSLMGSTIECETIGRGCASGGHELRAPFGSICIIPEASRIVVVGTL